MDFAGRQSLFDPVLDEIINYLTKARNTKEQADLHASPIWFVTPPYLKYKD